MFKKKLSTAIMVSSCFATSMYGEAQSLLEALKEGSPTVQLRLRYEDVSDDTSATGANDVQDLTLRTAIGYKTGSYMGFSAYAQLEDISMIDDNDTANADTRASDINQAYVKYSNSAFESTLGRQTIIYDNARHVGNVGWRQNDQTFDALSLKYKGVDNLTVSYNYIWQVNRIFATQEKSSHHLLNAAYKFGSSKLVAYYYGVDFDVDQNNAGAAFKFTDDTDTYGLELSGAPKVGETTLSYSLEYAQQTDGSDGLTSYDANYINAEVGAGFSGVSLKVGYELLGEDNGKSFATPLATVHAFNGWSDKALVTQVKGNGSGIEDTYFSVGGKVGGVALLGVYHDLSADTGAAAFDGSEIDLLAVYKCKSGFVFGGKAAFFDADTAANDLEKFWIWTEYKI